MIRTLIEKWASPAGIAIVIALVIWLVQLNQNAIRNAEAIGSMKASQSLLAKEMAGLGLTLQRTVALQEAIWIQVENIDDKFEKHEQMMYQNGKD